MGKSGFWYVPADIAVIRDGALTPRDKAVFMVICTHTDRHTRTTSLAMKKIALESGCSERSALNAVNALVSHGVIERERRFNEDGQTANLYRVIGHEAARYQKETLSDLPSPNKRDENPAPSAENDEKYVENCTPSGADSADQVLKPFLKEKEKINSPLTPQRGEEGSCESVNSKTQCQEQKNPPEPVQTPLHEAVLNAYNEILPELPRADRITPHRAKALNRRIREDPARDNMDWWRAYFQRVRQYPWLLGENPHNWNADFDWLISENGLQRVVCGRFMRRIVPENGNEAGFALQRKYTGEGGEVDAKSFLRDLGIG